jgi:hypothetical protein
MEQANEHVQSTPERQAVELRPAKPLNMAATLAICAAGWLVPGLGHILLQRWIRGLILAVCVLSMFSLGIGMHGRLYDLAVTEPLQIFAFIANAGVGIPYLVAEYFGLGIGMMTAPSYDYGTTYLWVAGLLNYLIMLDAFDIAQGRKR